MYCWDDSNKKNVSNVDSLRSILCNAASASVLAAFFLFLVSPLRAPLRWCIEII